MFVVCPHLGEVHPDTRQALDAWDGCVIYRDLADDPEYGYATLLRELWANGETFAVVEHDVVPGPTTLDDMEACRFAYCAAPYPWKTTLGPALGCTKFAARFLHGYPDAMEIAARLPSNYGAPGHYRQLDVRLMQTVLRDLYRRQPHGHEHVEHRNPDSTLIDGARVTATVDGRSYLPPNLVTDVARALHHS